MSMKISHILFVAILVQGGVNMRAAWAATEPSQAPLYSAVPGAKPNLMLVLDNSGSMGYEYPDSYSLLNTCKGGDGTVYLNGSWRNCSNYNKNGIESYYGWYSMRSNDFNLQYYNSAITYLPRVNANGVAQSNPLVFIDNQSSGQFSYSAPAAGYSINSGSDRFPLYTEYSSTISAKGIFTYVRCAQGDCSVANRTQIDISYPPNGNVNLPAGHSRTDCGKNATTCSKAQELQNILNWYVWYRNRSLAVGTAIGQALQSYENKFRIGYLQYNTIGNKSYATASSIQRGVRYFRDDAGNSINKWKSQLYDWLYGIVPAGGTPSHQALSLVADYYSGTNSYAGSSNVRSSYGNPWKNDPVSTSVENNAQDLACRRSFAIVLSDGAWNKGTSINANSQYASIDGTQSFSGKPGGNSATLKYSPNGASGYNSSVLATKLKARNLYIPYGDGNISSKGFADLTADFFWNRDFSKLDNNVLPLDGQYNPTFWQNLTTYTIGWGLTPSGDDGVVGGLTWAQINKYNNDWLSGVASPVKPAWANGKSSVDLNSSNTDDSLRVNDFIRAGYTGGGASL